MWLENLKELTNKTGLKAKAIAEKANLPERTVKRVLSGETDNPYIDTLHRIVTALGGSLDDILADTKVVVADSTLVSLQEELNSVTAERDTLLAENAGLKEKNVMLSAELRLVNERLAHKEELLALHNHYNKIKR